MANNKDSRKKIFPFDLVEPAKKSYQFKLAFASAPHPHKVWKGGEDALFVSRNIILIADGVGGWAKMGIDSGVYARRLVDSIKELIHNEKQLYFIEHPEELAIRAVQQNDQKGSATLSILTLHPQTGTLRSYHIGDSVYGIFSKEGTFFMAQEQQRSFNVPFQVYGGTQNILGNESDSDGEQVVSDVFKGAYHEFTWQQLQSKVIVLASDGLWDNLTPSDVQKQIFTSNNFIQSAKALVKRTKEMANLTEFESPFYLKAKEQGHKDVPKIGKVDDTTLIIASVIMQ